MADTKPDQTVELTWIKELQFSGRSGGIELNLDSESVLGPSPVQALAFGLAACMAMDVVHILQKARQNLRGLRTTLSGWRADEPPRRFEEIQLRFFVSGDVGPDQVERAISLSREKYCSVWHSMRQDILLETSYEIS